MKPINVFVLLILFFGFVAEVSSSLLVTPTRVTFGARDRVEEVTLVNTSDVVRRYKLEWVQNRQDENNQYFRLSDSEIETFAIASPFVRFSPRRVTLKPGESQKVKLLARRQANMEFPEYRSHLRFTALPPDLTDANDDEENVSGVQLKLNLLLSYTIPVVLRTEATNVQVKIDKIDFTAINANNKVAEATIYFSREGNTSAYGDATLYHRVSNNDDFEPVGYTKGINIFHEQKKARIVIPWTEKPYNPAGEIKVVFEGIKEMKGQFYTEMVQSLY